MKTKLVLTKSGWRRIPIGQLEPISRIGEVMGKDFRVLVGSRDERGCSFDEIATMPGHWQTASSHKAARAAVESVR